MLDFGHYLKVESRGCAGEFYDERKVKRIKDDSSVWPEQLGEK